MRINYFKSIGNIMHRWKLLTSAKKKWKMQTSEWMETQNDLSIIMDIRTNTITTPTQQHHRNHKSIARNRPYNYLKCLWTIFAKTHYNVKNKICERHYPTSKVVYLYNDMEKMHSSHHSTHLVPTWMIDVSTIHLVRFSHAR